jgi:membrane protease YdiL (CAAX protease family)
MTLSRRDRISAVLYDNRLVTSAELFIVTIFQALDALGFPAIFFLFPFSWISLRLRKMSWRDLGLRRPTSWLRTIGIGATVGVVYQLIELQLIDPLLVRLTNEPMDLSQFEPIRGSIPHLVVWVLIGWIIGAFAEEMVFRGYLLNRFADLVGHSRAGWLAGVLASSALFAIGHAYLGMAGVLENFVYACVFAGLYLAARRNLWLVVTVHGFYNTLIFVLIYLGLYP